MKKTATRVPKSNRKVLLMINRKNAVHVWEKDEIKKQKAKSKRERENKN
jgi:hypothetical protein